MHRIRHLLSRAVRSLDPSLPECIMPSLHCGCVSDGVGTVIRACRRASAEPASIPRWCELGLSDDLSGPADTWNALIKWCECGTPQCYWDQTGEAKIGDVGLARFTPQDYPINPGCHRDICLVGKCRWARQPPCCSTARCA